MGITPNHHKFLGRFSYFGGDGGGRGSGSGGGVVATTMTMSMRRRTKMVVMGVVEVIVIAFGCVAETCRLI